jgi:hypothetical protein
MEIMKNKIKLDLYYENNTKEGFFAIDMQKVKRTNRIVCGDILDILDHLGYDVEFEQHYQEEEIKNPLEYYIENIFNIMGDDVLNKLSTEQVNQIAELSKKAKEMEKEKL